MLRALIFTVMTCGFAPRLANERDDAGEVRITKIKELIRQSCYSIHDISRMEPMDGNVLPRFNMPFELGLDMGCREYGNGELCEKKCLILEKEKYRYQKVISDISGSDIKAHDNSPEELVKSVRAWLRTIVDKDLPSGTEIWQKFNAFYADFFQARKKEGYGDDDILQMPIKEFISFIDKWTEIKSA